MDTLALDLATGAGATVVVAVILLTVALDGHRRPVDTATRRPATSARREHPRSWARELIRANRYRPLDERIVLPLPVDPFGDPAYPVLDGFALFIARDLVTRDRLYGPGRVEWEV